MQTTASIYVAGHVGLVGSAICRRLEAEGYRNLITRSLADLDLTRQESVDAFFREQRPDYVFLAAAKVGGILANATRPAEFIGENLLIQTHVIDAAYRFGVKKLLFLGSSCIYPKLAPQPITESSLLTSPLEPTNEWYAIAKIAGLKMCQAYRRQYGFPAISLMPTNLYGPGDNFDLQSSHVLPALLRRFHEAKLAAAESVTLWGTGTALREFLHVDDLAAACVFLMRNYDAEEPINVGSGEEVSIAQLAELVKATTACPARILWDPSKPDGTPRKMLDTSRLRALGWQPRYSLSEGLRSTYEWFLNRSAG